eukprot:211384-Pelagomonas_calceolata.AAC.1
MGMKFASKIIGALVVKSQLFKLNSLSGQQLSSGGHSIRVCTLNGVPPTRSPSAPPAKSDIAAWLDDTRAA